ncbi:hypothetical protein [Corynebacterium glutamicum]|uniref:hypothetical protein n=1 Tax=Corynebacterium glutamicum TaxID=1718 RepID=UPI001E2894E1|nr:hypothetical protein [Corynebacterium glutamicum]
MDEQRAFDQGLKEENTLITDLTTCARLSHNKALRLIKLSKSTAYYRNKPRPCPAPKPVLQAVPAPTAPGVELAAPGVEPTPEPWQGRSQQCRRCVKRWQNTNASSLLMRSPRTHN